MSPALETLTGWGRALRSPCVTWRPSGLAEAAAVLAERPRAHGLIAHAGGRSYGDCALNGQGAALLTGALDRVLAWDAGTGVLEAQPGVTFAQLVKMLLPQGYMVPVTPGTSFATLGGAVANDVHGKNHEVAGSFCQHVTELDVMTSDGALHTIGPERGEKLFQATAGGLGLTGVVTRIALRMKRVASNALAVRRQRLPDLDSFLTAMDEASGATHAVGWIDGVARGRGLGRGILETAEPASENLPDMPARSLSVPFDFPNIALNSASIRAFNAGYFRSAPRAGRTSLVRVEKFFYPLDAIQGWNRIYGRRGFHQFQNVVPFDRGPAALRTLLEVIAASGRASFLAVVKRFGAAGPGYLSFPQPGYTLALDFPAGPGIEALYAELVAITLRFGGRVYLAKDALLTADAFRAMYPRWRDFQAVLEQVDPQRRLQSDMSRRLRLREA